MLWPEREVPQFGTGTFTPTGEDGIVLRIKNVDRGLGEKYVAFGIIERANADKGVRESWEDMAFGGVCA